MKKKDIEKIFPNVTEEQVKELEKLLAEAYEKGKAESDEAYKKSEITRLLDEGLASSGAKNKKAVAALLELDKISLKDGKLDGFSEQIDALKESCDYLFESDCKKPRFTAQSNGAKELTKGNFDKLSYKKRLKLFLENPALYRQLLGR